MSYAGEGQHYAEDRGYSPQQGSRKRGFEDAPAGQPDAKRQAPAPVQDQSDTVYRLLIQAKKVGGVIGKAGAIVKQIREETGARIRVVEGVPNCDERVIVISSRNDPAAPSNSAQEALFKVHARVHEEAEGHPGAGAGVTRMLVCHTQAGSLIGKAGAIIKEIREASGASIKILPPEDLPPCGLSNDRVVQMSGPIDALGRALVPVTRQIRENPPKEKPGGPPPQVAALINSAPQAPPAAYSGSQTTYSAPPRYR